MVNDRDLNAVINLNKVGGGLTPNRQTPEDMTALPQYYDFLRQPAWMKQEAKG
jgi:hypothetical protein